MGLAQFTLGPRSRLWSGVAGDRSAVPTASVILALVSRLPVVLAFSLRRIGGRAVAPVVY